MKQIKALAISQTRLLKQLDVSLTLEAVAETTGNSDPRTLEGARTRLTPSEQQLLAVYIPIFKVQQLTKEHSKNFPSYQGVD